MTLKRHAAATDHNQQPIVEALRGIGVSVAILSERGVPDILWGHRGVMGLIEVKGELGPRGGGPGLTQDQIDWWEAWQGPPPRIARSQAEAISIVLETVHAAENGRQ